MKEIITKVYDFDELNSKAKDRARDWFREVVSGDEWWDSTYEDAKQIGLKITGFDLGRAQECTGEFTTQEGRVARKILGEHGKDCETFKTATAYLADVEKLGPITYLNQAYLDDLNAEFLKSILEDYRVILQNEYEYAFSEERIDEGIRANEYTFTAEGKRMG